MDEERQQTNAYAQQTRGKTDGTEQEGSLPEATQGLRTAGTAMHFRASGLRVHGSDGAKHG